MSVLSAVIPVTVNGQTITLNPPNQPSIYYDRVAIYNASGYLLTYSNGKTQDYVNPSTAALFTLQGNANVIVTANAIPGFTLPSNTVWAVFYDATDSPGTFPLSLPAPGAIGLEAVGDPDTYGAGTTVGAYQYAVLPATGAYVAIPAGALRTLEVSHVTLSFSGGYGGVFFSMLGNVSGYPYMAGLLVPPYAATQFVPQLFEKSWPRGINLGDTEITINIYEVGATLTGWTGLLTAVATGL